MSDINNITFKNKPDSGIESGLYIIATPIGNLRDITLRALDVLNSCDIIVCEDTRVTVRLLSEYGISKKLIAYNDHNAERTRPGIIKILKEGKIVALVSDAGTPLISDPGYKLNLECHNEDIKVTSLPGPCSAIAALTLSTQPTDSFFFHGFLPNKTLARKNKLAEIKSIKATIIFFERAERVRETLPDILEVMGNRKITIAREITKKFEEVLEDSCTNLINTIADKDNLLGEVVLLVGSANENEYKDIDLQEEILELKEQNIPAKTIAEQLALKYNLPKKQVYAQVNELKK